MTSAVAHRYARAFADLVMSPSAELKPGEATAQLRAIGDVVASSTDLQHALVTPAVRPAHKKAVLDRLAADLQLSRLTRNFLFVLVDHRRIQLLPEIQEAFEVEIDQRLGFVRADVSSAQPLDERQSTAVENELSRLTGKKVRARFHVDASLIGGIVARIGSTVYDGSIRGQLENIRRQIAHQAASA